MRTSNSGPTRQYERAWAQSSRAGSIVALTHPTAVLIFSGLTVVLSLVAEGRSLEPTTALALAGSMALAQATIGVTNEIADRDIDSLSKPWRALPAGLISPRSAALLAVACCLLAILLAATVSIGSAFGLALGVSIGVLYNIWLKRTVWSWVPYVLAYPLIPVWVWLSLGKPVSEVMPIFAVAAPLAVSIHMVNQLRDYEQDRIAGVYGFVQHLGKRRAVQVCFVLLIVAPLPALVLQLAAAPPRAPLLFVAAAMHWFYIVPLLRRYPDALDPSLFRTLFRRLQVTSPLLLLAWILNI